MTDQKRPLLDGFGHSVDEQIAASSSIALLYGAAPALPIEPRDLPWYAPPPSNVTPPVVIPPPTIVPRPDGYMLTVTGPMGSVFSIALTATEWEAVRGKILEALK